MRPFYTALSIGLAAGLLTAGATIAQQSPTPISPTPPAPRPATTAPAAPAAAPRPAAAAPPTAPATAPRPAAATAPSAAAAPAPPAAAPAAPARPASAPAAPAAAAPAPAPAAPAQPTQSQPVRTETITYENWTVTCREVGSEPKRNCSAVMQAIDQNRKQVVLTWIFGHTPEGALTTVLRTPTGIQIQRGVELRMGDATPHKLNYVNCDQQQCEATMPMDAVFVRDASAAQNATAVIVAKTGQTININMSIGGFEKAAAAVTKG